MRAPACVNVGTRAGGRVGVCMRVRACTLANPACKICGISWRHSWPFVLYHTFRHYIINGANFGKKLLNINIRCYFLYKVCLNHYHSKNNLERYRQKCRNVFTLGTRYFCRILVELEFSTHTFEKKAQVSSLIKIRPVGAELFHADTRTEKYEEANSRFSQFCERALKQILSLLIKTVSLNKLFFDILTF